MKKHTDRRVHKRNKRQNKEFFSNTGLTNLVKTVSLEVFNFKDYKQASLTISPDNNHGNMNKNWKNKH